MSNSIENRTWPAGLPSYPFWQKSRAKKGITFPVQNGGKLRERRAVWKQQAFSLSVKKGQSLGWVRSNLASETGKRRYA